MSTHDYASESPDLQSSTAAQCDLFIQIHGQNVQVLKKSQQSMSNGGAISSACLLGSLSDDNKQSREPPLGQVAAYTHDGKPAMQRMLTMQPCL